MAKKKTTDKAKDAPLGPPTFQRTKDNKGNTAYVSHCRRFTILQVPGEKGATLWEAQGADESGPYNSAKEAKKACRV